MNVCSSEITPIGKPFQNDQITRDTVTPTCIAHYCAAYLLVFLVNLKHLMKLTLCRLLYADDRKLIASRKQADALQSSLLASSKWSEDLELILNPSKSEHLPIGNTSNPVAYSLTSHTSPNAQPVQTVCSVRDLGLLLNTGFSAYDNVARATKKARGMLFFT